MKSEAIVGHKVSIWIPKGKSSDQECFVGGVQLELSHNYSFIYNYVHNYSFNARPEFVRKWPLLNQDSYFHLIEKSFLQEP